MLLISAEQTRGPDILGKQLYLPMSSSPSLLLEKFFECRISLDRRVLPVEGASKGPYIKKKKLKHSLGETC